MGLGRQVAGLSAAALLVAGCSGGSTGSTASPRSPSPDGSSVTSTPTPTSSLEPADFTAVVDNPWFPLQAGDRWVYAGSEDGDPTRDVVVVTHHTKTIAGVRCVVVSDDVFTKDKLSETTFDYYAQDRQGNVWYFGEDTGELDAHGKVKSREGTWLTGRAGARPGVIMPAHPVVGASYEQEHFAGHAEDHARVVALDAGVTTPAVSSQRVLVTVEWTPLEPKVREHKYYVRGYGQVKEEVFRGGQETSSLVSYTHGH